MNEKQLSVQALKKLAQMDYEDKVRLFARCCILKQNLQIAGILTRAVGQYAASDVKAEIVHHLYDENDQYRHSKNYNELLDMMINKENVYKKFDEYTLCAYAIYYDNFIDLANGAKDIYDVRRAKEQAYHNTLKYIDRSLLNADYVENPKLKTDSMLKKDYRRALVYYLAKDLNITNGYEFIKDYVTGTMTMEEAMEDYYSSMQETDPNKVYANQVDEYVSPNGTVYYIDPEGDCIDYDKIEDYKYNDITIKATKHGLVEVKDGKTSTYDVRNNFKDTQTKQDDGMQY